MPHYKSRPRGAELHSHRTSPSSGCTVASTETALTPLLLLASAGFGSSGFGSSASSASTAQTDAAKAEISDFGWTLASALAKAGVGSTAESGRGRTAGDGTTGTVAKPGGPTH